MTPPLWKITLGFLPLLLALCLLWIWISRPSSPPPPRFEGDDTLRVATANVFARNGAGAAVPEFLGTLDLDVLIVLEWTPENVDLQLLRQSSLIPILQHEAPGVSGLCVLAREGLDADARLAPAAHETGKCRLPMATVRLTVGSGSLSLLGVHAPPPTPRCGLAFNSSVPTLASWIQEGTLTKQVGACMPGDRVLVLGDFNLPPFWPGLRRLEGSGLVDAYAATNRRPGPTWGPASWFPALGRIDYAFVPESLQIHGSWNLDVPGSDHRMIIVDLSLESIREHRSKI
jgi:endonuclease/exonuclease/phosphatase (EEP) superfamily protein YafD